MILACISLLLSITDKVMLKVWPSSSRPAPVEEDTECRLSAGAQTHRIVLLIVTDPGWALCPRHFGKGCPGLLAKLDHSPTRWIHPLHLTDKQKLMLKKYDSLVKFCNRRNGGGGQSRRCVLCRKQEL